MKPGISVREIARFADGSRETAYGLGLDSRLVSGVDVGLAISLRRGRLYRQWLVLLVESSYIVKYSVYAPLCGYINHKKGN